MKVVILKQFDKQLEKLPKATQAAAVTVLKIFREAPNLSETNLEYKKIAGRKNENYYRIRVGQYRIGIELIQPAVIVITIYHRQDAYRNFP